MPVGFGFDDAEERFARRGNARKRQQALAGSMRNHFRIAIGRDDHLAACGSHRIDLGHGQLGAAADQRIRWRDFLECANGVERTGPVERHFEHPKAALEQGLSDHSRIGYGQAAQNRDQWAWVFIKS